MRLTNGRPDCIAISALRYNPAVVDVVRGPIPAGRLYRQVAGIGETARLHYKQLLRDSNREV